MTKRCSLAEAVSTLLRTTRTLRGMRFCFIRSETIKSPNDKTMGCARLPMQVSGETRADGDSTRITIALMFFIVAHSLLAEQVALNFKVLDEKGLPIEGARVVTVVETEESLSRWHGSPKHDRYVAITDSSGEAVSRVKSHDGYFRVYLTAEGYYEESDTTNRFAASYDMMQKRYVFSEKEKSLMYVLGQRGSEINDTRAGS